MCRFADISDFICQGAIAFIKRSNPTLKKNLNVDLSESVTELSGIVICKRKSAVLTARHR